MRFILVKIFMLAVVLSLTACKSTQTRVTSVGPSIVGPTGTKALGSQQKTYEYASDIFLNVAVPVFDPGLPLDQYGNLDDKAVVEQGIWPQVRRMEANRFAVYTKEALAKTRVFGAVNVTPDPGASADVYVLGKINYSDAETVKIGVRVIDATNRQWDEKVFEHTVSEGFYRDAMRGTQNPYDPVFRRIADYVYELVKKRSEAEKQTIQRVAELRYAAMYSPEAFMPYLKQTKDRKTGARFELAGLPAEDDPMLVRVNAIRARDLQFVSELQDNYDTFHAETDDAYHQYHREALPIALQIRRNKADRTKQQVAAAILGIGAAVLGANSNSSLGQAASVAAAIGAAYSLNEAVQTNRELSAQRELLNEKGQNLDITVTPHVIEFNEQTIELSGTAGEQHAQLRQRLLQIYQLESTPDKQL